MGCYPSRPNRSLRGDCRCSDLAFAVRVTDPAFSGEEPIMHIDCDHCAVRGPACSGCVITVLLGSTPDGVEWDETERAALGVLADSGLVPPLRLVPASGGRKRAVG